MGWLYSGAQLMINCHLAVTNHGSLALVASNARRLDEITILHGSDTPMILRPAVCEEEDYPDDYSDVRVLNFVGDAYVEDMMQGQAVYWEEDEADNILLV